MMATFGEIPLHRCGSSSEASSLSALAAAALGIAQPSSSVPSAPTQPLSAPTVIDTAALLDTAALDTDVLLAAASELTSPLEAPQDFQSTGSGMDLAPAGTESVDAALATIDFSAISLLPAVAAPPPVVSGSQEQTQGSTGIPPVATEPAPLAGASRQQAQGPPLDPLPNAASGVADGSSSTIIDASMDPASADGAAAQHSDAAAAATDGAPLSFSCGRCSSPSGRPGRISIEGWVSASGNFQTLARTRSPNTSYILAFASVAEGGDEVASGPSSASQQHVDLQPPEVQSTAQPGATTSVDLPVLQPSLAPVSLATDPDSSLATDVSSRSRVQVQRRQARSQEHPTVSSGSDETPHLGGGPCSHSRHSHDPHGHTSGRRGPYRTVSELLPRIAGGFSDDGSTPARSPSPTHRRQQPSLSAENSSSNGLGVAGDTATAAAPFAFLEHLRSMTDDRPSVLSTSTFAAAFGSVAGGPDAQQGVNLLAVPRDSSTGSVNSRVASTNSSLVNAGGSNARSQQPGGATVLEAGSTGRPPVPSTVRSTTVPGTAEHGSEAGPVQRLLRGHRRATTGTGDWACHGHAVAMLLITMPCVYSTLCLDKCTHCYHSMTGAAWQQFK
jgi:hypothetical protein